MTDYGATWQTMETELYEFCRRRPDRRTFDDVYPKVAIIGRVYAAGISRSSRASGDREAAVPLTSFTTNACPAVPVPA